jgi:hypothetical protein
MVLAYRAGKSVQVLVQQWEHLLETRLVEELGSHQFHTDLFPRKLG